MQTLLYSLQTPTSRQSSGVRVMLLSVHPDGTTARRLAENGNLVDVQCSAEHALARILSDSIGFDLFVMDCDGLGGIDAAEQAIAALVAADARMRVMLVSKDFDEAVYPFGIRTAVCLPTSVHDDGFRQGLDHVLRDRPSVTLM